MCSKVGFGKDEMCSYKHTHNGAVHINKETGEVTKVSDKGGDETQYFNIKDGDGNLVSTFSGKGNSFDVNYTNFNGASDLSINVFNSSENQDGGFVGEGLAGGALGSSIMAEILDFSAKVDPTKGTGTINFAKEVAVGKTLAKGAKVLGRASGVLSAGSIIYDFGTGTANTSTLISAGLLIGGIVATAAVGTAALPVIAVVGISYGIATVFGFDVCSALFVRACSLNTAEKKRR